jgi:hypothetical protein
MPTKREREYYRMGYTDGINTMQRGQPQILGIEPPELGGIFTSPKPKRKRKLSAWQKYIKNKRNHIKFRDGKLNLKKMGVEFRRKKRR